MRNDGSSIRIDIFETDSAPDPVIDFVWIVGWVVILAQLLISIVPWVRHENWGVFLVTVAGTALALLTSSLRQWKLEKWPGRKLNKDGRKENKTKSVALTRGNGHRYVMAIIGKDGAWDLENFATASSKTLGETVWCLCALAALWVCLLISVSGLRQDTWFFIIIGGIGMLQNIYASAVQRRSDCFGFRLKAYAEHPTIIGTPSKDRDDGLGTDDDVEEDETVFDVQPGPETLSGVRGALRELEKIIPGAGCSLMLDFFPYYCEVRAREVCNGLGEKILEESVSESQAGAFIKENSS